MVIYLIIIFSLIISMFLTVIFRRNSMISRIVSRTVSGLPLALFRISFSCILLWDVFELFFYRHLIFDDVPYMKVPYIPVGLLQILWIITLVFILVGYRTREAAILNYLFCVIFIGYGAADHGYEYHVDTVFITSSLYLIFMPSDKVLSIRSILEKRANAKQRVHINNSDQVSCIYSILLTIAIGVTYLDSSLYKLSSDMYTTGLGVWAPSSLPYNTFFDISWALSSPYICKIVGYLVLLYEITFSILVWFNRARIYFILFGILLHIGILVAFPIPIFSLAMISLFIGITPEKYYYRLFKIFQRRKAIFKVYYDEDCPLCRQTKTIFNCIDPFHAIEWRPLQSEWDNYPLNSIAKEDLLRDIHSIDSMGKVYRGVDTYIKILKSTGWLYIPGLIVSFKPFRYICNRIYAMIAEKRGRDTLCNDYTCNVGPAIQRTTKENSTVFAKYIAGFILKFAIISFIVISFSSPFYSKYIISDSDITNEMHVLGVSYSKLVYPWTGYTSHGVFLDDHFKNYNTSTMFTYRNGSGVEEPIPIISNGGFAQYLDFNRRWAIWTFRTVAPGIPMEIAKSNIKRFAAYYAIKNKLDLEHGEIVIYQRQVDVSLYYWKKDLYTNNLKKKWKEVGSIRGDYSNLDLSLSREPDSWGYLGDVIQYSSFQLPGVVGKIENSFRLAKEGIDNAGVLTFGPYIQLAAGNYEISIEYQIQSPSPTLFNTWDITFSDGKSQEIFENGQLDPTGKVKKIELTVDQEYDNVPMEIRTYFGGKGELLIKKYIIRSIS